MSKMESRHMKADERKKQIIVQPRLDKNWFRNEPTSVTRLGNFLKFSGQILLQKY